MTGEAPAAAVVVDVIADAAAWDQLPAEELARKAVAAALAEATVQPAAGAEVSIVLTDDARIQALNRQWRGLDKPTNVLSFPAADAETIGESAHLGDIILAYETIAREAEADGKTIADHLCHLVIHGILHLLGEDHMSDQDAEAMEAREVAALARLGIADPYRELPDV
jgi:probable rRNA maturation factor